MYDNDLLEGQIITHWFKKFNDKLEVKFKENVSRLIDHLEEESSEEESD